MTAARLSQLLRQPGGMTAAEAAAAAHGRLQALHEEAVAGIDSMIARMAAFGPRLATGPDRAALDELYVLANAVFGTAGLFGLGAVGEVAYSLCELIDRLRVSGAWHPSALQVRLSGLVLGRQAEPGAAQSVTDGLRRVVGSVTWAATGPAGGGPG